MSDGVKWNGGQKDTGGDGGTFGRTEGRGKKLGLI